MQTSPLYLSLLLERSSSSDAKQWSVECLKSPKITKLYSLAFKKFFRNQQFFGSKYQQVLLGL